MYYKQLAVIWLAVYTTGILFPFLIGKGTSLLVVYKLAMHFCTVPVHILQDANCRVGCNPVGCVSYRYVTYFLQRQR